ncbi:helix-turn-helix domain-containing protein [Streptococcus oralis]|uniref:helix-turn-helix domain-containing protein n=1 Tax=Streptococcus oralis TaxID=1303 RepID=UPI0022849493|nr:helix-turn-helix transcriptional regulator [Streptococcus oralis]MCY7080069.1 helix-turn-helix domain-containing protein [Streptococcus oralis]
MDYEKPLTKRQCELFAFMLKQKRKDKKLSQENLGKKLGYCRSHIYKWENLKSAPDLYNVEDVATYFNLPMNVFIGEG